MISCPSIRIIRVYIFKEFIIKEFNQLYIERKFDQAKGYLLEHKSELQPALFHYNFAVVQVKLGDLAAARYHFEQARALGMTGTELNSNLEFTTRQLNIESVEHSQEWLEAANIHALESNEFAYHALFLLLLSLCVYLVKRVKKIWLILIVLLALGLEGFYFYHVKQVLFAVTLKEAQLREGPSMAFDTTKNIPAGLKVIVRKRDQSWYLVEYPQSMVGWVSSSDLGFLEK